MRPALLLLAIASLALLPFEHSEAQSNGVRCPAGHSANFSGGILRCSQSKTFTKASICPPITHPQNVTMNSAGSDTCLPVGSGNPQPSGFVPPLPGEPNASAFRRVVSVSGVDSFRATQDEFAYPTGHIFVGLNPERGVRCTGSGVAAEFSNNTLRCVRTETRRAYCTPGWVFDQNPGRDHCLNALLGKRDPTLPEGQISSSGWTLLQNHSGTLDHWRRTSHVWPVVN